MEWFKTNKGKKNSRTTVKRVSFLSTPPPKKVKGRKEVNWMNEGLYTSVAKTKKFPVNTKSFPLKKSSVSYFGKPTSNKNKKFIGQKSRPIEKAVFMKPVKLYHKPSYNSVNKKSTLVSSEVLLYGRTNLKRFGDRDMDGSPNNSDCSPGRVDMDGPVSWLKDKLSQIKTKESAADDKDIQMAIQRNLEKKEIKRKALDAKQTLKEAGIELSVEDVEKDIRQGREAEYQKEKEAGRVALLASNYRGSAGKLESAKERVRLKEYDLAQKELEDKPITAEDIRTLTKAKEEQTKQREKIYIGRGEKVLRAIMPTGTLPKTSQYSSPSKVKTGTGKAGRPKGSFKENQYIPGVGLVDVYTWRKYQRKQRAIARMSGPNYNQQYAQAPTPQYTSTSQYDPTKVYDQGNYDEGAYQAPEIYDRNNLPPDQAIDVQNTAQRYQRAMWNQRLQQIKTAQSKQLNSYQQAQLNEQMNDNTLNAPNFMKGELTNVGGQNSMTYTSPENNILNAPNVNLGQMRNVGSSSEKPAVTLSERPITNPHGEQYTEIDPVSGKVMLKKRISEKWMTGEAY
jgi:hypothetical protein